MLEMSEKTLVVQHNAVIEARYKLSVEEQRLIKTLVSQIQSGDEDFKIYEIKIADLAKLLDVSGSSYYDRVKKVTRKILGNVLSFTDENGNEIQTNWLSSAKYYKGKGMVALRFDPELKPYLLQLKKLFTSYELGNILHLKGMYSIRIYELLKQYERIGRREFTLEGLKHILKIDSEYPQYRDFKKFVLLPAEKEISEKTDIKYFTTETKKGRKVVGLTFTINSNSQKKVSAIKGLADKPRNALVDIPATNKPIPELVDQLVKLGVSQKTAETLVKEHQEERIKAAILYTQAQQKEGKVKNPGGFVVEAIKKEYRDNQAEERAKKEKVLQEAKALEKHKKKWEQLKASYVEVRKAQLEAWRSSLDENVLAGYREKFMETVPPIMKQHKNILEQMFLGYLQDLMPFPSLRELAKQNNLDISEFENEVAQEERQTGAMAASPGIVA